MKPAEKVEKLQSLLVRIRENALKPRIVRPVAADATASPVRPVASFDFEEEVPTKVGDRAPEMPMVMAGLAPAPSDADVEVEVLAPGAEDGDEELLDEDIVDLTDAAVEGSMPPDSEAELDIDVDVEPPSSQPRPKLAAASMDEALSSAARDMEDREPLKTPPPESGNQVAPMPPAAHLQQPPPPQDLTATVAQAGMASTLAQIGGTIDLGRPQEPAPDLDFEAPRPPPQAPSPAHELEAKLGPESVGAPAPTPSAEALLPRTPSVPPPAKDLPPPAPLPEHQAIPQPPPRALSSRPAPALDVRLTPEVVARPLPTREAPVAFIGEAQRFHPQTFAELLDASLAL